MVLAPLPSLRPDPCRADRTCDDVIKVKVVERHDRRRRLQHPLGCRPDSEGSRVASGRALFAAFPMPPRRMLRL